MNLTSRKNIKNLLKKYQIYPSKRLGQNFLIDKGALRNIVEAVNLNPEDTILEVGPGLGVLTQELAKTAEKVIAVEKDPKMVEILEETLRVFNNIEVVQGDILRFKIYDLPTVHTQGVKKNYKIVANIPYYLTSPLIRKFLEEKSSPKEIILMVQKEVAQRICAEPPDMNLLTVSVQFYANPKIINYVSKKSFWPQPKVDSAIIKITPTKLQRTGLCELFFKIVKAGFAQPRKQLINNLSGGLNLEREKVQNWLLKNNVEPTQRAETLEVQDWINLTKSMPH